MQGDLFENVVSKMSVIVFWPLCVNCFCKHIHTHGRYLPANYISPLRKIKSFASVFCINICIIWNFIGYQHIDAETKRPSLTWMEGSFVQIMAWGQTGGKLLSKWVMALFTGAYKHHSASVSGHSIQNGRQKENDIGRYHEILCHTSHTFEYTYGSIAMNYLINTVKLNNG